MLEVADGVASIYGLKSAMADEMLEFTARETGETVIALVLNLNEDSVGAAIVGDYLVLKEGDEVRRTGRLLEVPAGPAMLGRVVDPLGRPVDGLGPIKATDDAARSRSSPRASSCASPSTSRCRPASRPSTR